MALDPAPLALSFALAAATTAALLVVCLPLARWRLDARGPVPALLESLAVLPMALPPTVIGFYFLVAFAPDSPLGRALERLAGVRVLFSFGGLLLASCVVCFPFMYRSLKAAALGVDPRLTESSLTLGKGRFETFWRVELPEMAPGVVSGAALTFAHGLGEFGVALMVGGGIPGRTRTASIALFERVEAYDYPSAHAYALVLLAAAWLLVGAVDWAGRDGRRRT